MSVGIYDADMGTYLLVPFNLTAMKISAYYKHQRDIVLLMKNFRTDRSSKVFFVKDWDDGQYPSSLYDANVKYYGHAFSGPQYVALDEDIELMQPDTTLYSIMEKDLLGNASQYRKRLWNDMVNGEHIRLSLDGQTIWKDLDKQFINLGKSKSILIHDYDLGQVDGAWAAITDILSECRKGRLAPNIGMKFPATIATGKELLQWSSVKVHPIFYSLRYNGIIDESDFVNWCANGYKKTAYSMLEYNITAGSSNENDFVMNRLQKIFRQVIISRSYRLKILLKYEDDFFVTEEWRQLIDLFNYYQHSMMTGFSEDAFVREVQNDTLYDFAKKSLTTYGKYPKMLTKEEMKHLFAFVRDHNRDLFNDFYELNYLALKEDIFYD